MKIITNNSIYVQKNDIAYLNSSTLEIPASIFMKVFNKDVVIIDDSNRYEFVEFNAPEEIEFLKNIDWIIDYNEVKNLSLEEIISLGQNIADEKNSIARHFNSMELEERKENMNMVSECENLDFKIYSLRDFLWFKQGHLNFDLPKDISSPEKKEKGIKRLIKSIFN